MDNINHSLQTLFAQHGVTLIPLQNKAFLHTRHPALLQGYVTQQQYPNGVSSQLDVVVTITNRTIIESFGDIGETAETAVQNNFQNFARSSFHVLLGALTDADEDDQISIEQWQIGTQSWKVYGGNYGIKSTRGLLVHIPEELMNQIESLVRSFPMKGEYHWFRFFASCLDEQMTAMEFLVDNDVWPEAQEKLAALDWKLTADFYSIRLFVILQKL